MPTPTPSLLMAAFVLGIRAGRPGRTEPGDALDVGEAERLLGLLVLLPGRLQIVAAVHHDRLERRRRQIRSGR